MRAVKDNREYTVNTDAEAEAYRLRGFDIYGDDGVVKAYGAGKKVELEKYMKLKSENEKITAENEEIKKELKKFKKELETFKKEPVEGK